MVRWRESAVGGSEGARVVLVSQDERELCCMIKMIESGVGSLR
jgi:hypothetical protein